MGFEIEDGVLVKYIHEKRDTKITILDNITYIKDKALYNCSSLTRINVNDNNMTYCSIDGVLFSKDRKKLILCLRGKSGNYVIPESVTTIGNRAFEWCVRLTDIILPDSITIIDDYAFEYCCNLKNIVIPSNVKSIGKNAFYNCSGLTTVNIPDSVDYIGNNAFLGCRSLVNVSLPHHFKIFPSHTAITYR